MSTAKVAGIVFLFFSVLPSPMLSFGQTALQDVQKALADETQVVARITSQVEQASSETQAKVNELPQPTIEPKSQIQLANDADRTHLCGEVTSFVGHAQSEEGKYSILALVTIVLAAGLALVGSIASFLAKNKTAGVIGLIVAAVVGFSNAYPIGPLADFYRVLTGEAKGLRVECDDTRPYTVNTYASNLSQLKLLYVYEEKRPAFGNYRLTTDDLTKQLQVVRTASNNLTVAQTENASSDLIGERFAHHVAAAPKKK